MEIFRELMILEKQILDYYMKLALIHQNGKKESLEYQNIFDLLLCAIDKENDFYSTLSIEDMLFLSYFIKGKRKFNGESSDWCYQRIFAKINHMLNNESYVYESFLRYDIHQIVFAFIEKLTKNPTYSDISPNLIQYQYQLIFINLFSEEDFIQKKEEMSFKSKSYVDTHFFASEFVDKTVLVLESTNFITILLSLTEDFRSYPVSIINGVVSLMEVLARLVIADDNILPLIEDNLMDILKDDKAAGSVKELIQEMLNLLMEFQEDIQRGGR